MEPVRQFRMRYVHAFVEAGFGHLEQFLWRWVSNCCNMKVERRRRKMLRNLLPGSMSRCISQNGQRIQNPSLVFRKERTRLEAWPPSIRFLTKTNSSNERSQSDPMSRTPGQNFKHPIWNSMPLKLSFHYWNLVRSPAWET